nr:hypothetical protein [Streptomyces tendae]
MVDHQIKLHPAQRDAEVCTDRAFADVLTVPVIGSARLFDWWRREDRDAVRHAVFGDTGVAQPPEIAVPDADPKASGQPGLEILVKAYSPIAHGTILKNAEVRAMAERHGVSVPQLCIRHTLRLGTVSLPMTANPEHMRSNADVDFDISGTDMDALRDLHDVDYGDHSAFPVFSGK